MERVDREPPAGLPWIVEASVDAHVALPGGDVVARDDFHAWLWERADGLLGIDEGAVTAADAAARGLVPTGRVIDAAAVPPDRDWVAGLAIADVEWWFTDEASARAAVTLVAGTHGCRVRGVRADVPIDREAASRAAFGPISVPGFGVVRPAWDEGGAGVNADGAVTIFIEPGVGFGTGLHETTQMCLAALAERHRCGGRLDRVLDYGSGSGILAIAAAVLGAGRVDAVEIDEHVHPALQANARRNGVAERIHVAKVLGEPGPCDLVVANIVASVLVEHAAELCEQASAGGGAIVLSGLLAADVPEVVARYAALLGARPRIQERGEWRCLTFSRG